MRVGLGALEQLDILLDGSSSVEDTDLDVWHVVTESLILVADLVSQLASVAHDEDRGFARDDLDLLKGGEDEDGSLTETGFGLTENIGSEDSLGNANLLDCRETEPKLDKVSPKDVQVEVQEIAASVHRNTSTKRCYRATIVWRIYVCR